MARGEDAMADEHYDAIVIGTSQGGRFLPVELAKAGKKVALVERGQLGGVCVNTGCTPTKTMVASARLAYQARRGAEYGVRIGPVSVDLAAVRERKRAMVAGARENYASRLAQDGLDLIEGEARFTGPKTVEIALTDGGTRQISAPVIVIDAGTRSRPLTIPDAGDVPVLDSTSIMELRELPQHLVILGGGYIGLEFGQMFRRFGSSVTIVHKGSQLLSREDDDIAKELQKALEAEGIEFRLNSNSVQVEKKAGQIALTLEAAGRQETITGSHLLVATGRRPNTDDLGLDKAGVEFDGRGYIKVNSRLETNVAGIWALGDVKGGPAFTHISYNDYQIVFGNLIEQKNLSIANRYVPYSLFTDPQLGRVGMTEKEARASGQKLKLGTYPMSRVARAVERNETAGLMKLVVNAETDRILGAAILSSEGGELVQILGSLMLADAPYTVLKGAVYIHPTLAEGFFGLMDSVKAV